MAAPDDLHGDREAVDQADRGWRPPGARSCWPGWSAPRCCRPPPRTRARRSRSTPSTVVGMRSLGAERDVGVGGADDEVHLLEDLRPSARWSDAGEGLDVLGRLYVEVVGGDVGRQHDLGREVRLARRVEVAEPDQQAGRPGHGPLQAAPGQRDRHVDPSEAGVLDQADGPRPRPSPGRRHATTAAPRSRRHGDRASHGRPVGPARLPSPRPWGARRGRTRRAPLQTSNQRAVSRTERDRQPSTAVSGSISVCGPLGIRPKVAFSPNRPGEAGRDPDGAAAVTTGGDGEQAAGDRGRRAARGAARRALQVVGVRGRAVQAGVGAVDAAELRRRRLPGQHGPGRTKARRHGPVVVRHPVLEDQGCLGLGPPLDRVELLDADGHAAEGQAARRPWRPCARACSSSTKQTAFSFDDAMAASDPSRASVGEMVPARKASTSEQASPSHGSAVTHGEPTGRPSLVARRRPVAPASTRSCGGGRSAPPAAQPRPRITTDQISDGLDRMLHRPGLDRPGRVRVAPQRRGPRRTRR